VFVSYEPGNENMTTLREDLDWADAEITSLASLIEDVELQPQPEIDQEQFLPFEPANV
jgi:uncharacterized protein YktA (UPF0223 family)